mgnify:CR=1 FL=1
MALKGLWQSFFSHYQGAFNLFKGPKRLWSRVTVAAGQIMAPAFNLMWNAMGLVLRNAGDSGGSEGAADAGD